MSLSFNLALVGHLRVQPGMEAPQVPGVMVNENKLSLLYISHTDTIFVQNMTFVPDNVLDFS